MQHITDNHDALLDYLYEEGDPAERLKIARHLQECASCSVAVLEFQNVRGMLRDWTPPPAELGFRVVRDANGASDARLGQRPGGVWSWRPALHRSTWAQAAAAVLLFAAGMAVSQFNMNYDAGTLTVQVRPATSPVLPAGEPRRTSIELQPEVPLTNVALERTPLAEPVDTEQLLQRVRAMIDQSEQRQQRELAQRISQFAIEEHTQHQADMLRIEQNLGQQQDEVMNYLVRTAGGNK
jgi:anti-sigma factor RsiW